MIALHFVTIFLGFLRVPVQIHSGSPGYLPFHVLGDHIEGVTGPHITNGVAALVGGSVDGVGGARAPLVVGESGVRLQSMAEGNKAAADTDSTTN